MTTETALRELTSEQADVEAANFFPRTPEEKVKDRRYAAENLCRTMGKCVAGYLVGESSRRDLNRWLKAEITQHQRWQQLDKWKEATGARWDQHRQLYIAIRRILP